jgi:hypothetical protein
MTLTLSPGNGGKLEGTLEFVLRISGVFERASQEASFPPGTWNDN